MRVVVDVAPAKDGARDVSVRLDCETQLLGSHTMRCLAASPWVAPCDRNFPSPGERHGDLARNSVQLERLMERFEQDELNQGDVELLGRYLFDSLLGRDVWEKVLAEATSRRVKVVELALSWDASDYELHRLSWEAMHDGTDFLGVRLDLAVAVVRLVRGAKKGRLAPHPAPAKVLFAVGADLNDPDIRPGAEVIGLLRGIERGGSPIDSLIIDKVTLSRLADACQRFDPHIVHIVSHGRINGESGRGEIELLRDELDESGWATGAKLLKALAAGKELPSMVVLTGCESAAAGEHMDCLAAELVKAGIPAVIGMAGRVADPVCRLFSRKFGIALSNGERLVEAMTHGRRAGLMQQQHDAADDHAWTLPSIYLAQSVPVDHAPIDITMSSATVKRIADYGLWREPVFCGRQRLGRLLDRLLDERDELQVLVAYTEGEGALGKTRLLHEFARRSLWAGHVVVMIDDDVGDPKTLPNSSVQLAAWLLDAIGETRRNFGLGERFESQLLDQLLQAVGEGADTAPPEMGSADYHQFLGECKETKENGAALEHGLRQALIEDLKQLMADVRDLADEPVGERAHPVLVLGGIGHWGKAADVLCQRLITKGLGEPGMPVPVFATCSFKDAAGPMLEDESDMASRRPWVRFEPLKPFDDHEGSLAYQWVLLHPWSPYKYGELAYAPNLLVDENEDWQDLFRENVGGIPGGIDSADFYNLAHILHTTHFFVGADDDEILVRYANDQ